MIYISQGHEKGIGLEIFLKTFLTISSEKQKQFCLCIDQDTFNKHLIFMGLKERQFKHTTIVPLDTSDPLPQSTKSLLECLKHIKPNDILVTLPTSKDQLILNGKNRAGYTEFFREYYSNDNIAMVFKSFTEEVLLISDHIPLSQVSQYITQHMIESKISMAVDGLHRFFRSQGNIEEVFIAGINPHAGEKGVLGTEEVNLAAALNNLKKNYPIKFSEFLSGDTLHIYKKFSARQLFVYMYHDQGLSKFKAQNGFIGLNISMGLPFLRLSVDHGTAFDQYGKNTANIVGMLYLLQTILKI